MATQAQLRTLRLFANVSKNLSRSPVTLKHRSLSGTETSIGNNELYTARSGNQTLETTTDYQVWFASLPVLIRESGSADGGDSAAGAQWTARNNSQISALDINGNPIQIADDDWLVLTDGSLLKIENPIASADGSYYTFSGIVQR